jgi:hypothetical protein
MESPTSRRPLRSPHHIAEAISLRGMVANVKRVNGFNAKIAVFLTTPSGQCGAHMCSRSSRFSAYGRR